MAERLAWPSAPDWIPAPVFAVGASVGADDEILHRMFTDQRMKGPWREVSKRAKIAAKADTGAFLERLALLPQFLQPATQYMGAPLSGPQEFTLVDRACMAFFLAVPRLCSKHHTPMQRSDLEDEAAQWEAAATLAHKAPPPLKGKRTKEATKALTDALALVEQYFLERAEYCRAPPGWLLVIERGTSKSKGAYGDDHARGCAAILGAHATHIFGAALYGTICTTLAVALDLPETITPKTIENWCAGI